MLHVSRCRPRLQSCCCCHCRHREQTPPATRPPQNCSRDGRVASTRQAPSIDNYHCHQVMSFCGKTVRKPGLWPMEATTALVVFHVAWWIHGIKALDGWNTFFSPPPRTALHMFASCLACKTFCAKLLNYYKCMTVTTRPVSNSTTWNDDSSSYSNWAWFIALTTSEILPSICSILRAQKRALRGTVALPGDRRSNAAT